MFLGLLPKDARHFPARPYTTKDEAEATISLKGQGMQVNLTSEKKEPSNRFRLACGPVSRRSFQELFLPPSS